MGSRLPLLLLVGVLAAGCGRDLEDGLYDFVATRVRQDSCSSAGPMAAGDIWDGTLRVSGDSVRLDYDLHRARDRRAMLGRFLEPDGDGREEFIADATFDVITQMGPGPDGGPSACLAFAHLHLEAVVDAPDRFHGTFRVDYLRRPAAAPECLPGCVLDLEVEAVRIGPASE
jgi:hypothetical protein